MSYYLYDAKVIIKLDHAVLHKCLIAHASNSKVNKLRTEIASMSHVTFENIKGTANILADYIYKLRSLVLYDMQNLKERGKEFGYFMFDELPPLNMT